MKPNISEELCLKAEELIGSGCNGIAVVRQLTDMVDNMLFTSYHLVTKDLQDLPLALIAVGGYGRRELAPYSDVDIMLLAKSRDKLVTETAQAALYRFWDLGLNISHCFRTLEECVEDSMCDLKTRTSLTESRFLAGSREVFDEYKRDVYQKLLFKGKKEFIAEKLREISGRHKTYGESIYLLEPNVKEGRGGLRDIHSILWLSKVVSKVYDIEGLRKILSAKDYRYLLKAYDYFLTIRLCLHIMSKRKNDVLSFEFHQATANMLGFMDTSRFLAAEILMRLYYKKAKNVTDSLTVVKDLSGRQFFSFPLNFTIKKITDDFYISRNELIVKDRGIFKDSDRIMEAFYLYSDTGRKFSSQVRDAIKSRFIFINKKTGSSGRAVRYFLKVLGGNRVYETLRIMHDTGILDRLIPEFGRLRHLVIYEPYHRYTVDEHTLNAIKNLEMLKDTKQARPKYLLDILKNVRQETLFLAVLLHDIGKGFSRRGEKRHRGNHEETGYKMIKNVVERFGIDREDRQRIEFLVKNHVLLARLVLQRDSEDPDTISQLAEIVENEKNLDALYLMTYADMTAVNPDFWTEWKAYLFHSIYIKTKEHILGSASAYLGMDDQNLKELIEDMPYRYMISNGYDAVSNDYKMVLEARGSGLSVSINEEPDGTAGFTIVTTDVPGLFAGIVGVLGSWGLNILRARLYTGKSRLVIDRIIVSNWSALWWEGMDEQVKADLERAILKKKDSGGRATSPSPGPSATGAIEPFFRFESFVKIDNEASEQYSILELFSPDRLGLLYDIAIQFSANNVDILSAIINTEDRLARDVFYLQHNGVKLEAEVTLKVMNSVYSVIQ